MILSIRIPDDVANSGWPQELINEGVDMCWHSDDVKGLEVAAAVMNAIANILQDEVPEAEQQAIVDVAIEGVEE